ncbi:MAG: 1-acyl-sn-glycerol-3-phosphate acyltransferase [Flavobacteriales bacterium]|nr:1-acyl-sn-glycerol-3-phosphate acyltransferase [Flavobacteriales bacterium]MBT3963990.1 1-acyl-sn-glycerol-3-phosphate acyltransferase [Flavobacteriales bacterium]MBT4703903.1 1-acyl-sn-glycerol-3-phosphate acyltransferase [Flavobacteriales bacterium]MBT4931042.1 1-acyl-sn-glycerol-3-phosphate acyltransferase [Flavobacteriales bacterium]MBT5133550.1 1-acyl-sn-glycerol-3-phosphate acyltransferase [Flavobacteriales bacterium]
MYYVLQPLRVLWKIYFFLFFILTLTVFYPLFRWGLAKRERFPLAYKFMRYWSWWVLTLVGIRMRRIQKGVEPEAPFIICPNHSSYLDIITMCRVFKNYVVFMGKMEILTWPMFNVFFNTGMNISVDRSSMKGAKNAYDLAKEALQRGESIVLFPEGTIPNGAPELGPFKNGAFKLAKEMEVPILPVTFIDNVNRLQAGAALRVKGGPGPSRVVIHEAIMPDQIRSMTMSELKRNTFDIIKKPLDQNGD